MYCALPSLQPLFGEQHAIFQQDNAPCHTANIVKKWCAQNHLTVLPWPGNSPDMNQVENIWDHFERRIQDIHFKNADELLEKIDT